MFGRPYDEHAGRSTLRYYELRLREWRKSMRMVFSLAVVMGVAFAVPFWLYFPHGELFAGMVFGSCWGMVVWIHDDPPELIAKWKRGADGERLTAKELRTLEGVGWSSVHDRAGRYGNLDHIAVGPGGVFLLDSKNLSGEVSVKDTGLTISYPTSPWDGFTASSLARRMRGTAAYLKERIATVTGLTYYVRAVVVIWGDFPEGCVEREGVAYVAGGRLSRWLAEQPRRISRRDAKLIQLALRTELVAREAAAPDGNA